MNWEEKYAAGHTQRYPWDSVVSFIYRYAKIGNRILEVGCGTGSNLWFCAREGFAVAGIDISESAITCARKRFAAENLAADLRVGSMEALPFEDSSFDIAIDRGALTCLQGPRMAISEVRRVLKPGGLFFLTPRCASMPKEFPTFTREAVLMMLEGWNVECFGHLEYTEGDFVKLAEWRIVAKKEFISAP